MNDTRVLLSVACMQKNRFSGQGYLLTSTLLFTTVIPAVEISRADDAYQITSETVGENRL